jgi:predicted transcriptional regulator
MSKEEQKEIMVYVKGKLVPLKDLEKEYPQISMGATPGKVRVIEVLAEAEKPLNKAEIAKKAGLSEVYTRYTLKELVKGKFAVEFQLGSRVLYYLLAEKGVKLFEEIISK